MCVCGGREKISAPCGGRGRGGARACRQNRGIRLACARAKGGAELQVVMCVPVEKAMPSPKKETALMSDSCPLKVRHEPSILRSHTFANASHAPETKTLELRGDGAIDITSPL